LLKKVFHTTLLTLANNAQTLVGKNEIFFTSADIILFLLKEIRHE
jgi:hypothetical protein